MNTCSILQVPPVVTQSPSENSLPAIPTRAQRVATQTRARRQAAGKYATPAHKAAFTRRMTAGVAALTIDDMVTLSTHPHLTHSQRAEYAELAAQAAQDADTDDYEQDMRQFVAAGAPSHLKGCDPSEIRAGDRINHAGADAEVEHVEDTRHSFRFTIRVEATGSGNWVYYARDGAGRPFYAVWRYEEMRAEHGTAFGRLSDEEIAAEADEYEEDQLDRQFWARGAW